MDTELPAPVKLEGLARLKDHHTGLAVYKAGKPPTGVAASTPAAAVLQRLRADQASVRRWKKRIPFIAFFGLVMAISQAVALPRFLAVNGAACAVLGPSGCVVLRVESKLASSMRNDPLKPQSRVTHRLRC